LQREHRDLGDVSSEVLASKQAKCPVFQFGFQVPRNVKEAYDLDQRNGNTNWQDAMQEKKDTLLAYYTFYDEGHIKFLPGYKNIHVHFVFAVKHDSVGISLIPTPQIASTPVLSPSLACESLLLLGRSTSCCLRLVIFLLLI
jgi:hypothetical protein